ncbi:MAG: SpoVT / AbrB like domain protein [Candidatus Lokiarchaeum sp. GC14_75]|nr:MAG: SpoVT / AbrB like domain protein [Candidatus Lokiarchaeum sp. GC14_75]HEA71164.1 AbrB/MazE/SpoVT family DNA-binding domain-containing protein [archaeon]
MTIGKMKMQMTEKITQKVSSNGRIVIPKEWRDMLAIDDKNEVEMELMDDKTILIKKKTHPLEIEDNLFEGVTPFTEEELDEVKKSLFPNTE